MENDENDNEDDAADDNNQSRELWKECYLVLVIVECVDRGIQFHFPFGIIYTNCCDYVRGMLEVICKLSRKFTDYLPSSCLVLYYHV